VPVPDGDWEKSTLLAFEREMLGCYVSGHPLLGYERALAAVTECSVADLLAVSADDPDRGYPDGQLVTVAGILSGVQRKVTRQGAAWAAATLEDLAGAAEVLFFPVTYQRYGSLLADDAIVVVRGRLDRRDDVPKLVAMDVSLAEIG
jgi:DNA polymerase-3 subunit alpha